MDNYNIICRINKNVIIKMVIVSITVILLPAILFVFINIIPTILLLFLFIVCIYMIINIEEYNLNENGVYVCRRNGKIIYGYIYDSIEKIDITKYGNNYAIKIIRSDIHSTKLLIVRDKTKIIIPDYVENYHSALECLDCRVKNKFTQELNDYMEIQLRSVHKVSP